MKTKKYLATLLALVMLLSILPMAAFAASCNHTSAVIDTISNQYTDITTSSHTRTTTTTYICNSCFETVRTIVSDPVIEDHYVFSYSYTTDSEEGEEYRTYTYRCECGRKWIDVVFGYEGYPD